MRDLSIHAAPLSSCIITRAYHVYYPVILSYITCKISHKYEAEDLAQDVFVHLLDYKPMLQESTIQHFLYTIARNIVIDYLRRYYKKQEITSYIYDMTVSSANDAEEIFIAKDLLSLERNKLQTFSPQRKRVYVLSRFEEKTAGEISEELRLSKRTVENHLLFGRRIMRNYIRQCI